MDDDAVREYTQQTQAIIDDSPQMGEATTKAAILRNFLDLLGWEIPKNTQLEYSVKAFGRTFRVDYALVLDGMPVAFLEAKGLDTALSDDNREQIKEYMKSEDVNLGILTNGEEYEFFRREVVDSRVNVNRLTKAHVKELPEILTILEAFQKDNIQNEEWVNILNKIRELERTRTELENRKDEFATVLAKELAENVPGDITSQATVQAKEMIDRLIQDINTDEDDGEQSQSQGPNKSIQKKPIEKSTIGSTESAITGTLSRNEVDGPSDAEVVVFPTKQSGVDFLKENNAWGFVRIGREPDFAAMYVSGDDQEVKYIARVAEVVSAQDADLARPLEAYSESGSEDAQAGFDPNKKVVVFEENSLYEIEDPIPFENKWPQSLRYTTLGDLRNAKNTDELL
ncbi:type I restriction enzyme HsdR N-terminal domain-containing protein [Natranaeroarchaeum aerophilus]|uniref:Type I restriction enzyme HsdR N-terminal domain-containing protein n=1 Tax=Natranaeroarchaeum aerophilus TaxID=2917711 RepID=A0AAE3FRR3_9EURY|nr:type I restriction enzyme HsdR N-terminal domain-containing protein [Natranaeroarchaeum aerophilus]MCL9813966.1 type I restriction enzyme HsdR N-terminal domain-containing protein [Natranaeroarchaeum aerophilus]